MSMEYVIPPRGVSKMRVAHMMSRVRAAIKEFDPSYRLKKRGWICAKEWREICPPPFDYIWGRGYTGMAKRLDDELKVLRLQAAARDAIKIDTWLSKFDGSAENINHMAMINGHHIDWNVIRYAMRDIDVIGGMRRQKEAVDFMKGVKS